MAGIALSAQRMLEIVLAIRHGHHIGSQDLSAFSSAHTELGFHQMTRQAADAVCLNRLADYGYQRGIRGEAWKLARP